MTVDSSSEQVGRVAEIPSDVIPRPAIRPPEIRSSEILLPAIRPPRRRRGLGRPLLATAAVVLVAVGGWALRDVLWPAGHAELIVERAKVGIFVHDVVDRGEVESSANVDVVCE